MRPDRETWTGWAIFIVGILAAIAMYAGALMLAGAEVHAAERRCKTVTPQTFNKRTKILDAITGKRHHKASRKVCKNTIYRRLGQRIRKARKTCLRRALTVTASTYGTSAGDDNGVGYRGDRLFAYDDSFAELGWGTALGGLPLHAKRWIKAGHIVRRGVKRDIGPTHPGLSGTIRGIDLHAPLARSLRVSGLKIVQVSPRNCWQK